jgi:hypothetical protein
MRILFIDDERESDCFHSVRYRERLQLRYFTKDELEVLKKRPPIDIARNYDQAINFLQNNSYDLVCFDHDLGENQKTGMDIAKWVVENIKTPFLVYSHSANKPGRENIESLLNQYFESIRNVPDHQEN